MGGEEPRVRIEGRCPATLPAPGGCGWGLRQALDQAAEAAQRGGAVQATRETARQVAQHAEEHRCGQLLVLHEARHVCGCGRRWRA